MELEFVQEWQSVDTGGGFIVNVLDLDDGSVLVIGEDSIVLYASREAWEESPGEQVGVIVRLGA
jgi:hypothetical protein